MSDEHHGLPHDLPMPRAKVYKSGSRWRYEHRCPHRDLPRVSILFMSWEGAFTGASRHVGWCG